MSRGSKNLKQRTPNQKQAMNSVSAMVYCSLGPNKCIGVSLPHITAKHAMPKQPAMVQTSVNTIIHQHHCMVAAVDGWSLILRSVMGHLLF